MRDSGDAIPAVSSREDASGQDRIARNVIASWACHLVFIVAGFVAPRMIDRHLGQTVLGLWDFAWSVVSYFSLVQFGIASSVNRYVARYRAVGDFEGISRLVSSVTGVLMVMSLGVLGLTVSAAIIVPELFRTRLGDHAGEVQWVILLLGASIAVELVTSGIGGVVTGYQRWDLHSAIHAGSHAVTVIGMVALLWLGSGLVALALTKLIGEVLGRVVRCVVAYRLFPELKVGPRLFHWAQARELLTFGGKSFIPDSGGMLLSQMTNLILVGFLGPAALAVYARPTALVQNVSTLAAKLAMILTPTASSLQAVGRVADLRELAIGGTRFAALFAIPVLLILVVHGATILRLWMGPDYAAGAVLAILALGHATQTVHRPLMSILLGLNVHGRPGAAILGATVCGVAMTWVAVGRMGWGLVGAALSIALPQTLAHGVYVPIYLCRTLGIPLQSFVVRAWAFPLGCGALFGLCLNAPRWLLATDPVTELVVGLALGGGVLGILYWQWVLPPSVKCRLLTAAVRWAPVCASPRRGR